MAKISKQMREALEAVRRCCAASNKDILGDAQQWEGPRTTEIAAQIGKSAGQTSRLLNEAENLGLVQRSERRKGGWRIPPEQPEFTPVNHAQDATTAEKPAPEGLVVTGIEPAVAIARAEPGQVVATYRTLLEELEASGSSKELLASLFMADEMPLKDASEMFPDVKTKSA